MNTISENVPLKFEISKIAFQQSFAYTVEPQLSELYGRQTTGSDNQGVRIDEGTQNSPSMGYQVGNN